MSRQATPDQGLGDLARLSPVRACLALICLPVLVAVALAAPVSASAAPTQDEPPSIQAPNAPPIEGDALQGGDGEYSGGGPADEPTIESRQWRRCDGAGANCADIDGAETSQYTLTAADPGSTVRYTVVANCLLLCMATPFESDPTAVVQQAIPTFTRAGRTLTAAAPAAGTPPASITYRWRRCASSNQNDCTDIPGSAGAGQTFKLTSADIGRRLRVRVTASNGSGSGPFNQVSDPTEVVAAAPPTPTSAPVVSGTAKEGSTLTSTLGAWSGEGPISYSRNWVRCSGTAASTCTAIPGATLASYRATAADVGKRLRVGVRAEGLGSRVAFSAATAVVSANDFSYPEPSAPTPSPGLLTPFPRISIAGRARRSSTLITKFVVRAPRGSRVTIRCRGRRCPFRRASARAGRRAVRFRKLQRAFRTGTVIEVFVTQRGKIGKYTRFRFRRRRPPSRADGCLNPGAKRPTPCPGQ